jgi:hypothetical protein
MHRKNISLVLVAAGALIGFGYALRHRVLRHETEAAAEKTEVRRAQLRSEIRQLEQRVSAAEAEQHRLEADLDASRNRTAVTPKPMPKPKSAPAPASALRDALLNDPRMQNLQLAAVQAKLVGTYQPLCDQLHLSDAQVAQFFANVRRRGEQEMDLSAIIETQQLQGDDPVLTTMRRKMSDEFRAAQTALLGEAGFRQFESYERSTSAREFVNEVAGAAAILGHGITPSQADRLVEAMANASAAYRQGGMATRTIGDLDWERVLPEAAETLSAGQFAVFRNAVIQSWNMERIRQLARRK